MVLERSARPDARYQALATLSDVGLSRWSALGCEGRLALREYVWSVAQGAPATEPRFVLTALLRCYAALWKRGLDPGDPEWTRGFRRVSKSGVWNSDFALCELLFVYG